MKKSEVRRPKSEVTNPKGDSGKKDSRGPTPNKRNDRGLGTLGLGLRTLIIGYGNPLRSDDAVGWHASLLLAEALSAQDVKVITCHQLTPELAEPLSQCRRAVFLDADSEGKPGEIHRKYLRPQASASTAFTHTCTPAGLLASARQLYGYHPQAVAITVTAESFEFGETLTPIVAAALPKVVELVSKWIAQDGESRTGS